MNFKRNFSEYTPENTFKIAEFAGETILAHWKSGYNQKTSEPYGFWEYLSVKSESAGIGAFGKSQTLVKFSEKTPSDFSAFVPPTPKKPAVIAAAKNELPFRVCDESRAMRDAMRAKGYSDAAIIETLTKEFPPETKSSAVLDF